MRTFKTVLLATTVATALGGVAAPAQAQDIVATFTCDDDKTIEATFKTDSVDLVLSDGRTLTLPVTPSGGGARYAEPGDAVVFWNVGNTAYITEGNDPNNETYKNCVAKTG